jgi:anti-anti-sigma factor
MIEKNGDTITAKIEGKLDRTSSPEFEKKMGEVLTDDVRNIIIDLSSCIYISSAGLRVILALEKKMSKVGGKLSIKNVPELIMEVFTETGLDEILTLD